MKAFRHVFALLVITSMLLTGCGAATPEAEEEIVITFWHQEAVDTRVKILQELLDEFYEETGIRVVQETMTWGEQFVKLMSAIEAGNPPDITWGTEGTAVTLLEAGAIVPMTDIVEEIDGKYEYVQAHRDRVFWSGEYWAVPIFALSYNYWYRADMFEEAGLDVPETWDDVLAAAEALNDPPNRWGIALPTGETMFGDQVMTNIMLGHGGTVMAKGNELVVNSTEMANALAMYNQLAQFTPPDAGNYTWPEAGQAFAQGKAAQLITFNAVLDFASVETNVPEDLGIAQMPHAPGYESATSAATLCIMMITDDPVKQEAIKEWFLWMLEPNKYGRFAAGFEPGLFLPITAAGLDSDTYWAHERIAPYADQVRRALELTAINKNTAWVTGDVPDPFAGTIYNAFPLIKAAQMVLFEGATPEEGAAEADRIIRETLGWE